MADGIATTRRFSGSAQAQLMPGSLLQAAINVFPVTYAVSVDYPVLLVNFVQDTVKAYLDAPKIVPFESFAPVWSWVYRQRFDHFEHPFQV